MKQSGTFENMGAFLCWLEKRDQDRMIFEFLSDTGVCDISGNVFFDQTRRRAFELDRRGLSGRHIGIMGRNCWQWLASLCAVFQVGGVAVLLSPELNGGELADAVDHADLAGLCCDEERLELAGRIGIPVMDMDAEPGAERLETFVPAGPQSNACILFTSGTTAKPKAAVFTHSALLAGICHNVIGIPFEAHLAVLPMHHIAGFAAALNSWYLNRRICLGENVRYLYRYLREMKPDYVLTVPSILQAILRKLKNGGQNGRNLGWNLQLLGCGGAAFPVETLVSLRDLNIRVLQSYGATEAGGIGFDWEMVPSCRRSIGKPCKEMEVKIVEGELYLRSPSLMRGYYKDPEATAEVLRDGWYATGDLCEQGEDGFLYLRGRIRNQIILSNGENVSPEQIEQAMMECGLIEEIMVGLRNEQITVWIYPKDWVTDRELEQAVAAFNATVPRTKQIVNVVRMEAPFEKTQTGKQIRMSVTGGEN